MSWPRWIPALAVAIMAAACGGSANPRVASASSGLYRGGVLRIVMQDPSQELDPQAPYGPGDAELLRCCLLRTLYSYRPGDRDRTHLLPDLASGPPRVSPDRLTWTFRIRNGVRYAPPFQGIEVTSHDIVRALLRLGSRHATSTAFEAYFGVISGFGDYLAQSTAGIAGLETPDRHTLVVHLTRPTGDLAYRFSLPATAPIPPSPRTPTAPFGAATGHDFEWGYFLVSTGPYMYAGASQVDYRKPPLEQTASGGFEPGVSIQLVRNPSWSAASDPLRRPLPGRIDIRLAHRLEHPAGIFAGSAPDPLALLRRGQADLGLDIPPDATLAHAANLHVFTTQNNALTYVAMNLAKPPFNDLHVRRAVADVLAAAPARTFTSPRHIVPDVLEQNLLQGQRPTGGVAQARVEMARSAYDRNHDGKCDATACRISAVTWLDSGQTAAIVRLLGRIGIRAAATGTWDPYGAPPQIGPISLGIGWSADYPSPSDFFVLTLAGSAIVSNPSQGRGLANFNSSLLGAAPDALRAWGYRFRKVPSVDGRINQCLALVGQAAIDCWAYADEYVSRKIVAWVPLRFEQTSEVGSARLVGAPVDPFTARLAVERLRGRPAAAAPPGMAHPPARCLPSPVPVGTYRKVIRPRDVPSDTFAPGTWEWDAGPADPNCVYRTTFFQERGGTITFEDIHPFTVPQPGVIELHGSGEIVARYRVVRRDGAIRLVNITPDTERQVILTTNAWIQQG